MSQKLPHGVSLFFKNNAFELVVFGFMQSLVQIEGYSIKKAALEAQSYYGLNEDNAPALSLTVMYSRKLRQFLQCDGDNSKVNIKG